MVVLYVVFAILAFGILIFVHEGGHFLVARACGVRINEFSIGMGPKLISWVGKPPKGQGIPPEESKDTEAENAPEVKHENEHITSPVGFGAAETEEEFKGTRYSLRLFPIGGYVSMEGEESDSDAPGAFNHKKPWQKILITAAGATMNILLGFLLTVWFVGVTGNYYTTTVADFVKYTDGSAAVSSSFLEVGDTITEINHKSVHNYTELANEIMFNGYKPLSVKVIRDGAEVDLGEQRFPTTTDPKSGEVLGDLDFYPVQGKPGFFSLMKNAYYSTISQVRLLWESLIDMIKGRFGLSSLSGPVGVVEVVTETAQTEFAFENLLYLFSFITLNMGVFNLLPIPALDGGRIVFQCIELVTRKRVPEKVEATIHGVGMVILLAFMAVISVKDIVQLFL